MAISAAAGLEDQARVLAEDLVPMRRNVAALGEAMRALDVNLPSGVVLAAANAKDCFDEIDAEFGLLTSTEAAFGIAW